MSDQALKLLLVLVVVLVSVAAGRPALRSGSSDRQRPALGLGEAFAAGVFLGAGLIHMLGDAQGAFDSAGVDYPYPMVTCGAVMLLLLWVEHLANHATHQRYQGMQSAWLGGQRCGGQAKYCGSVLD